MWIIEIEVLLDFCQETLHPLVVLATETWKKNQDNIDHVQYSYSWLGNLTHNYWVFTRDPMKYWNNMGGDVRDYKDKKIKSYTSNLKQVYMELLNCF